MKNDYFSLFFSDYKKTFAETKASHTTDNCFDLKQTLPWLTRFCHGWKTWIRRLTGFDEFESSPGVHRSLAKINKAASDERPIVTQIVSHNDWDCS